MTQLLTDRDISIEGVTAILSYGGTDVKTAFLRGLLAAMKRANEAQKLVEPPIVRGPDGRFMKQPTP